MPTLVGGNLGYWDRLINQPIYGIKVATLSRRQVKVNYLY